MSLYAVERDSPEALYAQIARRLEQEITHLYKAGEALPPETELAGRFGVNLHTLRRAVDEIVAAGMLERRHGRGVFVVDSPLDYKLTAGTRFTETLSALGKSTDCKVIRKLIVPASGRIGERLVLAHGEPTIWIETLRLVEDYPLCVISHFLPAEKYRQVFYDYTGGSLHIFLETHYGSAATHGKPGDGDSAPMRRRKTVGHPAEPPGVARQEPQLRQPRWHAGRVRLDAVSRRSHPVVYPSLN